MNKDIKELFQNKKFMNCLVVLLAIIFLWLAASSFFGDGLLMSNNGKEEAPKGAQEVAITGGSTTSKEMLNYEDEQKVALKDILSKIDGVGNVDVMIYFESGEVQVPIFNSTTQVSETEEQDRDGGTRTTNQKTEGSTAVMASSSSDNEPFITKTYKPQITGIVVVAEGAQSNKIKYDIQMAVSSLYNLSLEKVNVYPMAS